MNSVLQQHLCSLQDIWVKDISSTKIQRYARLSVLKRGDIPVRIENKKSIKILLWGTSVMAMAKTKSNSPINLKCRETNLPLQLVIVVLITPRRRPVKRNKTGEQETFSQKSALPPTGCLHPDRPLLASLVIGSICSTVLANLIYEFLLVFPSTRATGTLPTISQWRRI